MLFRGVRAAAVKAFGCGVIVVLSGTLVVAGQARAGQTGARTPLSVGALAPVTFSYTGGEQNYTVPAGVTSLEVQAVGADGGVQRQPFDPDPVTGGTGGVVIGELAVGAGSAITPGETLYVTVGGTPAGSMGGFNGGGSGGSPGSGGGGATDLRTCSPTTASCANGVPSLLTRLIVAAGGGGAGGCDPASCDAPFALLIGSGGSAGQPGGDPLAARGEHIGGGGGTLAAVGSARPEGVQPAEPGGVDGSGGQGSRSPGIGTVGGGGGGGGYFGGGGGSFTFASVGNTSAYVSGGGGGGSSFASPLAATDVSYAPGDGTSRLLITPRPASAIQLSRIYYNSPGPDTGTNKSLDAEFVRLRNTSRTARQLRGWSISDADGHVYRFGRLVLQPGASVTVHSGRGRNTASNRYWNRRRYIWDNSSELARLHRANGTLADQCRYDNSHANQVRC